MYQTTIKKLLADTYTPVSIYQKVRRKYPKSILLESSDYHSKSDSYSIIGFEEIASFTADNNEVKIKFEKELKIEKLNSLTEQLNQFKSSLQVDHNNSPFTGIYGYTGFDAVENFEPSLKTVSNTDIPTAEYCFFKNLIVFNHFNDELILIEHTKQSEESTFEDHFKILKASNSFNFPFHTSGEEIGVPNKSDFAQLVEKGIDHCMKGDVFQLVLSRQFKQAYEGDEFEVYRQLRSINPSPYLFFFDLGNYSLFGSSPEAHLKITNQNAEIHPIAGTYLRTGNDAEDIDKSRELLNDPKENAEHTMLVDLARNDLNRFCKNVEVSKLKELQFFSHVIHMVSKVEGELSKGTPEELMASTFPAGTLSGAPKIKALELIQKYEPVKRSFYGGAIGLHAFNGDLNHAIIIRSMLAKDNHLYYQAGAGIVAKSVVENEVNEVDNKIKACRTAIALAKKKLTT